MENDPTRRLKICLGSSCYCRGNARNAEIIQRELAGRGLEGSVELTGTLCEGRCKDGPVVSLDGRDYLRVQPGMAVELVRLAAAPRGEA